MKKLWISLASAALIALPGVASAAEPLTLSDAQMDSVTAGHRVFAPHAATARNFSVTAGNRVFAPTVATATNSSVAAIFQSTAGGAIIGSPNIIIVMQIALNLTLPTIVVF